MQLSDTWGRVPTFHMTNFLFIVMRIISMHITEHSWAFLIVFAAGSTFSPLGIRIGYTLGKNDFLKPQSTNKFFSSKVQ